MNRLNFRMANLYTPPPLTRVQRLKRWTMADSLGLIVLGVLLGAIIGVFTAL